MTTTELVHDEREVLFTVTDAPVMEDDCGLPFVPAKIRVRFLRGEMGSVCVTGPAVRKNGTVGVATRYRFCTDSSAPKGSLAAGTPDWVRSAVREATGTPA
ncbi:hypothetical protein [Prescottella agglutinans]|uniref:Uncharacterized protein n=1 Tax=Prescottella agglutinans TaxID=1644129 RepID=A0ABT6MIA6_9NOCA|nr:hypothetical protein [Prescottella agglutinans]MDH6284053.1 hypothetical protein [Prescottella agglutinans]